MGVNAAMLWWSATFRNFLGGVLNSVLAPLGVPTAEIQNALTATLAANLPWIQQGTYEAVEALTALWQPTAYAVTAEAAAIEALYNVAVSLRTRIVPGYAAGVGAQATAQVAQEAAARVAAVQAATAQAQQAVAQAAAALATEIADVTARAQADAAAAQAGATAGVTAQVQAATATARADDQAVLSYVNTVATDLATYTDQRVATLTDDLNQASVRTATEINDTRTQLTRYADTTAGIAAAAVGAGIVTELQTQVLPVLSKVATEVDTCVTPYCDGQKSVGPTLNTLATALTMGALLGFLAECVADPGAAAAEINTVLAPVADGAFTAMGDLIGLVT